ncbi:hypothetical protein D1631_08595 [Chryseobacterium nematophagum]|uniref:Uncharacterized protein n=1 Tax=Chryseobacterium nematophagum TaxID=2305228 RepID=A0A3M7TH64_9FLAO|nr:hypothetical protein [Chryseobacterium nematophagum]RNA61989.1 hypothetical protein D1631_08595 [Chryseobacterium nematophagum]
MDTNTSTEVQATTPTEEAVVFVNSEVLAPPKASPMTGAAKIMTDQAAGMMVQDLQSFLKGFEQIGLIAVSRLANNILTYGTYFHDPSATGGVSAAKGDNAQVMDVAKGNEVMRDLFKIIGDYAEVKTKITSPSTVTETQEKKSDVDSAGASNDEDPEKKKLLKLTLKDKTPQAEPEVKPEKVEKVDKSDEVEKVEKIVEEIVPLQKSEKVEVTHTIPQPLVSESLSSEDVNVSVDKTTKTESINKSIIGKLFDQLKKIKHELFKRD